MLNGLETDRLFLIAPEGELIENILSGDFTSLGKEHINIKEGWPTLDTRDALKATLEELSNNPRSLGFGLWIIIEKKNMTIVGDAGFKGSPEDSNGEVEIGYGILDCFRGKKYAPEAVFALINWVFGNENVNAVKAECLIDNKASISVLKSLNMKVISNNGEVLIWRLNRDEFKKLLGE